MSEFTCLLGEPALSDFRKNKLTRQLAVEYGLEQALDIRFTYFVEASQALSESGIKRLEDLLHGQKVDDLVGQGDLATAELILVVPRLGTQSPWSTKATEIANRCAIENVLRIERGTAFWVGGLASLSGEDRQNLQGFLHDRMTQAVLASM